MRLETKRLVLRPWKRGDLGDLAEGLDDLKVSKWLALVPYPYSRAEARGWIRHCSTGARKPATNRASHEFAIELKSSGRVIGGVSLDRVDRAQGTACGGIWVAAAHHGMGYGTEAYAERSRFAFEELGLRRIESGYFRGNEASARMHRRLGYRKEGVRTEGLLCRADGKCKDEVIVALLRSDWRRQTSRCRL
jgi:RimJ/RimL family protein N-acetyltransferase